MLLTTHELPRNPPVTWCEQQTRVLGSDARVAVADFFKAVGPLGILPFWFSHGGKAAFDRL
jgi:hypothetical protein